MNAIRLRTEFLTDPMGIDIAAPRLFWNCSGGVTQTAYQIVAAVDGETVWDSGKVASPSMRAVWGGRTLRSRDRAEWKIRLWDESGAPDEWAGAFFEMGLLDESDWRAQWITGNYTPKTRRNRLRPYTGGKAERYSVDCFKKEFSAAEVKKARLYITACGLYEARLNGARVGDFVMAPGYTDYTKRVQYQTYDVTALIKQGQNVLTVQLADGWYRGSVGAWGCLCEYGHETKLLAQLELTLANGSVQTVATDGSWSWSSDGPIRFADNKDGEIVDARLAPSYGGRAKETSHSVIPTASNNVPVREHERLKPALITTPGGQTVLDFGQNIAGYIAFSLTGRAGQRVFLRFGEMLDKNGEFTQKNIQCERKGHATPLQQVEYLCREGVNEYKTTFAVFGFQYVLVESDADWKPEDFTAIAVYSDMERTGWFESSNPLLDKFVENTVWSAKNNHLDIPTDCPTRERHGWTGDAQIFYTTAAYLFDYAAFGQKYLRDVYDWQKRSGKLPQIAPYGGVDFFMAPMDGSVGWADVGVLIPYRHWKQYGDTEVLRRNYEGMRRYAQFMMKRVGKPYLTAQKTGLRGEDKRNIVNAGQSFGEWAEPADVHATDWIRDTAMPHPEESTAYTCYIMELMAEIAGVLGKDADAEYFRSCADRVRRGYQALRRQNGFTLDTDRQASLIRPLYMKLLDPEQTEFARKRFLQALENYQWRLGTGFLSTPFILYVLAEYDLDAAYRLLENEEMPGWLFMPKAGANTIWESWEGTQAQGGIASLDHYSKGAVCEWLFSSMCGIVPDGENHFSITPRPGGRFTRAKAAYQSVYGLVESGWERKDGKTVYTITIPANCTAEIRLPDGRTETTAAGGYTYAG